MWGNTPPPIRTIHRNLLISSLGYPTRPKIWRQICDQKVSFHILGSINDDTSEKPTSKYNKNIFDIQRLEYFPCCLFRWRHGCSHSSNVCVVPGVIVNNNSAICHGSGLIAIVPPRCNLSSDLYYITKSYIQYENLTRKKQNSLYHLHQYYGSAMHKPLWSHQKHEGRHVNVRLRQ